MQNKSMSPLEQQVMNIVWRNKQSTVREIVIEFTKTKPVAYTTILTILQRLFDKGLLVRKTQGKANVYSPKITQESYTKTLAQLFLKKFIGTFGDVGLASFAQSIDTLPKEKREHLLHLLEQHEKNK